MYTHFIPKENDEHPPIVHHREKSLSTTRHHRHHHHQQQQHHNGLNTDSFGKNEHHRATHQIERDSPPLDSLSDEGKLDK